MKKRILSVLTAGAMLAGSLCFGTAADETAAQLLSPRSSIEIVDGKICGITDLITVSWLKSQFSGSVLVSDKSGQILEDSVSVPSDSTVSVDGAVAAEVIIPGDAGMDGKVNVADVTSMLKYIAKWNISISTAASDVTRDGGVNVADVTTLLKYIAKWDVNVFDEPLTLPVFSGGITEYKLMNISDDITQLVADGIKTQTGYDMEIVTERNDGDKIIAVGKNLHNKYSFIDSDEVAALDEYGAYLDTYGGDIYLTANSNGGIEGCINYITNQAFTPELDVNIAKGSAGVLGDLETLVRPLFTTVEIEGLKNPHRLLHVTDTHLTTVYDDEETAERRADVAGRLNNWMVNMYKKPSYTYFGEYFNYAENIGAEGIMLTGDITDSPSRSNRDILESEIGGCDVPSYYIYGNHDWSWNTNAATGDVYHSETFRYAYSAGFKQAVDAYDEDWNEYYNIIDKGDYLILSVDNAWNSFANVRRDYYNNIKKAFDSAKAEGKPVILMLHVPIHTDEMHEAIPHIQGNGYCMSYMPGQNLLYDLITAEDTPVKAIFCGHVHANYMTMVDGRIPQYLTGAGFEGFCRVIDLVPAE